MANYVELRTLEQVLTNYDLRELPFYAVYAGKDLKFYNAIDDLEDGRKLLNDNLSAIAQNGTTQIYKLVYYKDGHSVENRNAKGEVGSVTFKFNEGVSPVQYQQVITGNTPAMQQVLDELKSMRSELNAIKAAEEIEEDEEEETEPQGLNGIIAGFLQDPDKIAQVAGQLQMLWGMMTGPKNNNVNSLPMQTAAIGNINNTTADIQLTPEQQQNINAALFHLLSNGMTVEDLVKLANIAVGNKGQFTMLLGMLRAQ